MPAAARWRQTRAAGDAALGHRTPGTRWPSGAPGRGSTPRRLADRVRDQARRSDDPHVLSPAGPVAAPIRPAGRVRGRARHGQEWRHAAAPQRPLHHARPVAGRLPLRPRPSSRRDAHARRAWPAGVSSSPTTGPTPRPVDLRGPASTRAPTSTATAPSSTAPRSTPGSPTWRCWPGRRAMTPCSSATPTPRSTRARCRRATRRLFSYEGILPGFRALIEDPWEQGSPGLGALARRAGLRRPGEPARALRADRGLPRRR